MDRPTHVGASRGVGGWIAVAPDGAVGSVQGTDEEVDQVGGDTSQLGDDDCLMQATWHDLKNETISH